MTRTRNRPPAHPGYILKNHYLIPLELTATHVANTLGISRKALSQIINGQKSVTPDMALRLSCAFSTTPELWLNLQESYDLWHAERASGVG